jgi:4-hydroxy-tetrahydrodipicolinate synthase
MVGTESLHGVICAMVTPMNSAGEIDADSTRRLVDHLISGGVHGLMIAGTTGEGMLLTPDERQHLAETVISHVAGRIPVIVHAGANDTPTTLRLARHAAALGADAIAAIMPYFFTFDDDALFDHFTALCEAVPQTAVYPYAFPGNAKNDLSPALLARLIERCPNIAGVKASNSDLSRLQSYIGVGRADFRAFCGSDSLMLAALVIGAAGQVSGNSNAFPAVFRDLYDSYQQADLNAARAHQAQINRIRPVMRDGVYPACYKEVLVQQGIIASAAVRRPMRDLPGAERDRLLADLAAL